MKEAIIENNSYLFHESFLAMAYYALLRRGVFSSRRSLVIPEPFHGNLSRVECHAILNFILY